MAAEGRRTFRSPREAQDQFVRVLADERSCEQLIVAYAQLIDVGQLGRVAGLFEPDGVLQTPWGSYAGADALESGLEPWSVSGSHHLMSTINVRVDGAEADGLSYVQIFGSESTVPLLVGHFRDRFIRTEQGWRFAHRSLEVVALAEGFGPIA